MPVARALLLEREDSSNPSAVDGVLRDLNTSVTRVFDVDEALRTLEPGDIDLCIVRLDDTDDAFWRLVDGASTVLPEGTSLIALGAERGAGTCPQKRRP